ncbi:MAG: ABC transporter permease [Ferruginibacter sp.]
MRHKIYALINVMGLSVGICACIVIYLISSYELGVDNFHPDRDRIFRVGGKVEESNGNRFYVTSIPPPSIATLRSEIPEIENIAGYYPYSTKISIFEGGKKIRDFDDKALPGKSTGTIIADSAYFSIFKYEWLAGSEAASLRDPFKVVISEKKARIYFGAEPLKDIIGKEIVYGDSLRVTVSGIIKNWEKHTDFPYSDFISFSTIKHSFLKNRFPDNNWRPERENPWICAFVKIPKRYDVGNLDVKLSAFADRHMTKDPLNKFSFQLEPLSDVHFNNDYSHDGIDKAYRPGVYGLIGMAFFILMIAAINFINLSTAQSVQRAKEIGIRKVLGSSSGSLKVQFLMEAFVLTFFAACIAVAMVLPVLAVFKNYISSNVHFTIFDPFTIIFILVVIIATSLIAGFYPAQVLSSYSPIHTIKGEMGSSRKGRNIDLRRALIVFQFTISLVFIIIAIVVSEQIRFMVHSDFGFKSDAIITVNNWSDSSRKMKLLSEEIRHMPGVVDVVLQGKAPMGVVVMEEPIKYKGKNEINTLASIQAGDENFIPFYQIKLLAGRNLVQSDSLREFVINETFSRVLGFKNLSAAIGNYLYSNGRAYPIVGVVSDFH